MASLLDAIPWIGVLSLNPCCCAWDIYGDLWHQHSPPQRRYLCRYQVAVVVMPLIGVTAWTVGLSLVRRYFMWCCMETLVLSTKRSFAPWLSTQRHPHSLLTPYTYALCVRTFRHVHAFFMTRS